MDDKSVDPGNSVGSGASDAISGGDATEHSCGVAINSRNINQREIIHRNDTFDLLINQMSKMLDNVYEF